MDICFILFQLFSTLFFLQLELSLNNVSYTVDCQNAIVAWGPGGVGSIFDVAVNYKCDNDTQVNNYS